jgi:ubiquinone/menaquinone biosynthesis C-methylase UbiE
LDHADWDRLSRAYDRQLLLERRAVETALELAQPRPETALLDAGTGTGAVLRALASRADRPDRVVGVDSSEGMLARVPPLLEGWELVRADVAALPFDDASFDTATAVYLLHVLAPATRAAALGELRRVLRPGGRLVAVTPVLPSRALSRPLWQALGGLARSMPGRFGGMRPLDPRSELIEAGFTLERARTVRVGYYSLCVSAQPADKMDP